MKVKLLASLALVALFLTAAVAPAFADNNLVLIQPKTSYFTATIPGDITVKEQCASPGDGWELTVKFDKPVTFAQDGRVELLSAGKTVVRWQLPQGKTASVLIMGGNGRPCLSENSGVTVNKVTGSGEPETLGTGLLVRDQKPEHFLPPQDNFTWNDAILNEQGGYGATIHQLCFQNGYVFQRLSTRNNILFHLGGSINLLLNQTVLASCPKRRVGCSKTVGYTSPLPAYLTHRVR